MVRKTLNIAIQLALQQCFPFFRAENQTNRQVFARRRFKTMDTAKSSTQKWSQSLLSQMWPSTGHSNDNGVLNKGSVMRGSHSSNIVGHLG